MRFGKINRDKRLKPKKGKAWCFGCDCALVGDGQKCPNCGKRHGVRRFKKKDLMGP